MTARAWLYLLSLLILCPVVHATDPGPPLDLELRAALVEAIEHTDSFADRFEAEVWLVDMATRLEPFLPDPARRMHLLRAVHREASRTQLPPELVLAVMEVESRFDQWAISSAGALGLMQIMPFWLEEIKNLPAYQSLVQQGRLNDNLMDIDTNIWFGCTILKHYIEVERGHHWRALARYNGSVGKNWYPRRVYRARDKHWFRQ